jgi:hypothetical protein
MTDLLSLVTAPHRASESERAVTSFMQWGWAPSAKRVETFLIAQMH